MILSRLFLLTLAASLAVASGCDSDDADGTTLYGDTVAIGDGTARTYVSMTGDTPTAIGVLLTADALSGLPTTGSGAGHEMDNMHVLPVPAAAGLLTDHLSLDWNPVGHDPQGLFSVPHFDVHFYSVPMAERMTWTPADPDFANSGQPPAERYMPAGFIPDPSGVIVPAMGLHWLDGTDPTYAPGGPGFTEVFIWGSYDGEVVFAEPMITKAYLQSLQASGEEHKETLIQPQAVRATGLYPTTYSVRYDATAEAFRIELGGLIRRSAS